MCHLRINDETSGSFSAENQICRETCDLKLIICESTNQFWCRQITRSSNPPDIIDVNVDALRRLITFLCKVTVSLGLKGDDTRQRRHEAL